MSKHWMRTTIAAMLIAAGAATLPATTAAPASAAVCTFRSNVIHNDGNGGFYTAFFHGDSVCPNAANAPIYWGAGFANQSGTMLSTRSWFLCWVHGAPHAGGNNIWYYTQGDVPTPGWERHHAWGFMPAGYVFTTNDPGDSRLGPCPS